MKRLLLGLTLVLVSGAVGAQPSVEMDVQKVETEPVPLQSSEYADIWFEVTNKGSSEADPVTVRFLENYPFSVDPDEQTSWTPGSLAPGEEYIYHVEAKVDENAVQGENFLEFETQTGEVSITHRVPVEVRSDSDLLSVSSGQGAQRVPPGGTSEVSLSLDNMAEGQLKNVLISADFSEVPLTATGTSTRTISSVEPGDSTGVSYSLGVDESASNGVYNVPLTVEYENEAGSDFTREVTAGVTVGGRPDLQVGFSGSESRLTSGTQSPVTLRLTNQGQGTADFVSMRLQESDIYDVIGSRSVYIGEMEPDDFQTAEFDLYVDWENESVYRSSMQVPVRLEYETGSGNRTVTRTATVPLYSQGDLKRYGGGGGGPPLVPIGVAVVVLAGGGYYWRYRR